MIRGGLLCSRCNDRHCVETEGGKEPVEYECPICNGTGQNCEHCKDGFIALAECPNMFCREISDTVGLRDLYHEGLPPIAGGSLDQAFWFLEADKRLTMEDSLIKAERDV